jgi:hypothetical protein
MNLKSVEKLSDKLDEESSWRRLELTNLKFNIESSEGNKLNTNLRASLVLLYSHWEGFVKQALAFYLQHVSQQKLHNNVLKYNFYALEMRKDINEISNSKKASLHTNLIEKIFNDINIISNIPFENQINTKSNLNSGLFKELMNTVGLDSDQYKNFFHLIDERLLGVRNSIAHGEAMQKTQLTKDSYLDLHEKMIEIIDMLKDQIVIAAIQRSYMISDVENLKKISSFIIEPESKSDIGTYV